MEKKNSLNYIQKRNKTLGILPSDLFSKENNRRFLPLLLFFIFIFSLNSIDAETGNWVQVGNGLNITNNDYYSITSLNNSDIAFIGNLNDTLKTYRFDGTNWVQIGNGLFINSANGKSWISSLNISDIALVNENNGQLRKYRFDGTNWVQIGNGLSLPAFFGASVTSLNETNIAFIDNNNDNLRTYRFDGTNWVQIGNGLGIVNVGLAPFIISLNSSDIAFMGDGNLRTYRFNGTDWVQVGNSLGISSQAPSITSLNETNIAFIDDGNDNLRKYRFDGTNWVQIGNGLGITNVNTPSITSLNNSDIAFIDITNDNLRTYRFIGLQNTIITLISPDDESIFNVPDINSTINISFISNVTGDFNITNVSLLINEIVNQTNTSGIKGQYNFIQSFGQGSYNWRIRVVDENGIIISEQRFYAIEVQPVGTGGGILDFVFNYGKEDMPSWVRILISLVIVIAIAVSLKLYTGKGK